LVSGRVVFAFPEGESQLKLLFDMERSSQSAVNWPLINEVGEAASLPRARMDELWARGWRHFGPRFFRYSLMWQGGQWKRVVNLRVDLTRWQPSKSQRRTLRRNEDLDVEVGPAEPAKEEETLFNRHKTRFDDNVPESLSEFLGEEPNGVPTPCLQVSVRQEGRLVAASFLDLGQRSCSSIYGIFEPEERKRRLGIFTLLREMLYAKEQGIDFYYLGFACLEASPYDYKKELRPVSLFDWERWHDLTPDDYSIQAPPVPAMLLESKIGPDCSES
jgi:arginine-tRNA-protein transferase